MPWRQILENCRPGNFNDPWTESSNVWFKQLQAATKGRIGEQLCLDHYPGSIPYHVDGCDVRAGELDIECKVASRSYAQDNGHTWNQVRPLQNWTHLFLIAVDCENVRVFLVPKSAVWPSAAAIIPLYGLHHGAQAMEQIDPSCQIKTGANDPIPVVFDQFEITGVNWQEILQNHRPNADQPNDLAWAESEFLWVRHLQLRPRGIMGERMYIEGLGGERITDTSLGYDIRHDRARIEAKFSSRTYSGNLAHHWNQIRPGDNYTHLFLVAVDADSVRAFLMTKEEALPFSENQHGGQEDTQFIVSTSTEVIPTWMLPFEVRPE